MSDDLIKFGGVSLNRNEVSSMSSEKDAKYGQKFTVRFKNGTVASYYGTKDKGGATLGSEYRLKANHTFADNINGLTITGTSDCDEISVFNSTVSCIDVKHGGKDSVKIKDSQGFDAYNRGCAPVWHDIGQDEIRLDNTIGIFKK